MKHLLLPLITASAAAVCLLAFAPPTGADPGHTVSQTMHSHGVFDDPEGGNPCTNDAVVWHVDGNLVEPVTFFPNGDEFWATFTETGTVTFSEAGVDWSGHFTEWGNDNQNETNGNATFTTTVNFTASDGSIAQGHDTSHVLWDGVQDPNDPNAIFRLAFDKLNIRDLTCTS
jgi:hypothetical protein